MPFVSLGFAVIVVAAGFCSCTDMQLFYSIFKCISTFVMMSSSSIHITWFGGGFYELVQLVNQIHKCIQSERVEKW